MHQRARADSALETYRCPGASHTIDRAVHLGRLAAFYPACRLCEHRQEVHSLSPLARQQWAEVERRDTTGPRFVAEGLLADSCNAIDVAVARRFAGALAAVVHRTQPSTIGPTRILVGADGHWQSAELVAAACQALQWAGCRAIEVGAVTSACLAAATAHLQADAALWIGNFTGEPHALGFKVWGRDGRPWSLPGDLQQVHTCFAAPADRPTRSGGGLERADAESHYLGPLKSLFHGLRPLRYVVDTTCQPLVNYLKWLSAAAACEMLRAGQSRALAAAAVEPDFLARRLQIVGRQVVAERAHFGLWVDGDAETCHLVDEHGRAVPAEKLLLTLARSVCREGESPTLFLERESSDRLVAAVRTLGARVIGSATARQAASAAIESEHAVFGGGPSGRFWFAGQPAAPDALLALSLLLSLLSQSDRAVSEVLDAA